MVVIITFNQALTRVVSLSAKHICSRYIVVVFLFFFFFGGGGYYQSVSLFSLFSALLLGFYHRHSELIVKYNIELKTLLQQGISEPIFYGDIVYKFKRLLENLIFSDQFKKIVKRYIRVGYNLDIMRQSACLVLNPIQGL